METVIDWRWSLSTHRCVAKVLSQFGAVFDQDAKAKKLLQHPRSVEFVVWGEILSDILSEIGFAGIARQKSDCTLMVHTVDSMGRPVKTKTDCRTVLETCCL